MSIKTIVLSILVFGMISCGPDKSADKKSATSKIEKKTPAKNTITQKITVEPKVAKKSSGLSVTMPKDEETQSEGASPEQLAKAKEMISNTKKADVVAVDAKKKFKMLCASCHGFKGNMEINGAKNLTASKVSLEESVAQVYFGKGLMVPHKDLMSEAEIIAVSKYIISEFRK